MGISSVRSYRQKNVNEKLNHKNLNNLNKIFDTLKQECFDELFKKPMSQKSYCKL